MTEAPVNTSSLRLDFCPQCDYSLQGLPQRGTCPECGREYDQSMVVVRCRLAHEPTNPWWALFWVPFLILFILQLRRTGSTHDLVPYLGIGFVVAYFSIEWTDRLLSPRKGERLLWIAPQGMGLQIDFDPGSLVARGRKWLPVIYWIAYGAAMVIPIVSTLNWIAAMIVAVPILGIGLFVRLAGRPKLSIRPEGTRPGLIAWSDFQRIEVRDLDAVQHRLMAIHADWISRRSRIDVKFDGTIDYASELRSRISAWSGRQIDAIQ